MKYKGKKRASTSVSLPCDEVHADDQLDPRYFLRRESGRRVDRHTLQLCGHVSRTLNSMFAGELEDELLYDVYVQWVEPAPNASRLRVYLGLYRPREEVDAELLRQIGSRLETLRGLLRQEIAMTTQRRRTPDLVFEWGPLE